MQPNLRLLIRDHLHVILERILNLALVPADVEDEDAEAEHDEGEHNVPGNGEPVDDIGGPAHEAGDAAEQQRVEERAAEDGAVGDVAVDEDGLDGERDLVRAAAEGLQRRRGQVVVHVEVLGHLADAVVLLLARQDRQSVEDLQDRD